MAGNWWEKDPVANQAPLRGAQDAPANWWEKDAQVDGPQQAAQPEPQAQPTPQIPLGIPGAMGQRFLNRLGDSFYSGAQQAARGVGDIVNHVDHVTSAGAKPYPTFQEGNILTGVPRMAIGGLGAIFSPVTAAAAPIMDPVLQPVAETVDKYVSKPIENATGYPSDITTPAFLQGATMGIAKAAPMAMKAVRPKSSLVPRPVESPSAPNPEPVKAGPAPTIDEVRAQAERDYKASEDAGIVIKPETVQEMVGKLKEELAKNGYHPKLQPTTAVALEELANVEGKPITLKGVDTIRQVVNGAADLTNAKDMRMAGKVIKRIDEMVSNLDNNKVIMGNAEIGVPALQRARNAWARVKKAEILNEAMARAQRQADKAGSGGNLDNAIRQQIDRVLNKPSLRRGFTKDEIAQMETIVKGRGKIHSTLRLLGKLSPSGNGLMFALGGIAGASNPLLLGGPLAGLISKPISTALTKGGVSTLTENVLRGGRQQMLPRPGLKPKTIAPIVIGASSRQPERTY